MTLRSHACFAVLVLLGTLAVCATPLCTPVAQAQAGETSPPDSAATADRVPAWDRHGLLAVYRSDGPVVTTTMRAADAAAYPIFYGAVPAAWGTALARGDGYATAYRLTLSEGLALGAVLGLKKAFGRRRPYRVLPAVQSRSARYRRGQEGRFAASFPSGHATVAFVLATSISLSHPEGYVIVPAMAGATLVGASRLWLGVHYPSDVLAGALLGAAAAAGVHALRGALTPDALEDGSGPMVRLRVPLP